VINALAFTSFIIALLLTVDAMEPTGPWLVALAVLTGLDALRPRWSWSFSLNELFFAGRLAAFVIALLLAAGGLDPADEEWLVALTVLTGILAFVPRRMRWWRYRRWSRAWASGDWDEDW
jgi:hypothetical protein